MWSVRLTALAVLLAAATAGAGAKRCGDDVDGKAVPCDCGDVLVASRRLGPDDPITTRACPTGGLVVDVPADRSAVTLDLAGAVLSGSGRGVGIEVLGGGDGGVTIVGPGEVRRFDTGIHAPGRALARIADVLARDNARDGFDLGGAGYAVTNCEAQHNGRDGFRLRGSGIQLDGNRALDNARQGFRMIGREERAALVANEAAGNTRSDFALRRRGRQAAARHAGQRGAR
jgi:parallel beta-helix repeat protein